MILLPSATYSDVCKEFVILFVRFGRLAAQETLLLNDALSLLPKLREIYFNGESAPKECQKEEIDEMRILFELDLSQPRNALVPLCSRLAFARNAFAGLGRETVRAFQPQLDRVRFRSRIRR